MKQFLPLALLVGLLFSCRSHQELAYFADATVDSARAIVTTYNAAIHPGDQLYIYVYSQTPDAAVAFNQETRVFVAEANRTFALDTTHRSLLQSQEAPQKTGDLTIRDIDGYLVSESGLIQFPLLGEIRAAGLTQDSLSHLIQDRLINEGYILDPVVTVSPMNFRVSVIGEVRTPQEIHVQGDRLTILEALAKCGDITMDGLKHNVTVMRDRNGVATPIQIDLTKQTLFDSEVYYLQSNDIVYVEPTKRKKRSASSNEDIPKYVTTAVSLGAAVYTILRAQITMLGGVIR